MTTLTISAAQAAINLTRISVELEETQKDLALLERLKSAPDRAKRLIVEQEKALIANDKAIAALASAEKDARFNGIKDLIVVDRTPDLAVMRSTFEITFTSPVFDMYSQRSEPKSQTFNCFAALPDNVLAYLLEVHPSKLPNKITSIYPGDPKIAFERYFRGLQRGYLSA